MISHSAQRRALFASRALSASRAQHALSASCTRAASSIAARIAPGQRYAAGVVCATHARTVYLTGQVPRDAHLADAATQTHSVLAAVDALLAAARTDKAHLLSATVHLTHLSEDLATVNAIWEAWLPRLCAPARTVVGGVRLVNPAWRVEVTVTAAVPTQPLAPVAVAIVPLDSKFLCSCGASRNAPLCDGSHKALNAATGTAFAPRRVTNDVDGTKTVHVCACGHSKHAEGWCDGSHVWANAALGLK